MATTTNFGWETPDDTDLVKDGAAAMRTLGSAIDTSMMDLKGGTTGQVLSKASNTDMDFTWVAQDDSNAIQNAIVDAKGDLISATAADTPARLAVGTNGQVLTADSSTSTGLKWTTPSADALTLVTKQTITSSFITLDSVFTSTYKNYLVRFAGTHSNGDYQHFRMRTGGTTQTSTNYVNTMNRWTNPPTIVNYSADTFFQLAANGTAALEYEIILINPQATANTQFQMTCCAYNSTTTYDMRDYRGFYNATTSFDGIYIYSDSGSYTGTLWIYGYGD